MQLISRRDASLATSLVIGTFVLFNRPLQDLFELASTVEQKYNVALVPALTVLAATLAFHQYKQRREISEEARQALARTEEAERLLKLGRALAESLDREAVRQALQKLLPTFCGDRRTLGTPLAGSAVARVPGRRDGRFLRDRGTGVRTIDAGGQDRDARREDGRAHRRRRLLCPGGGGPDARRTRGQQPARS